MSPQLVIEFLAFGVLAGAIGALFGIGGGIALIPVLTLVAGLPIRQAVGISIVSVVAVSAASTLVHARAGRIAYEDGIRLQFFAVAGAVSAGLLSGLVPERIIEVAFAGLLVLVAFMMMKERGAPRDRPSDRCPALACASAVGSGVVAGLLGVGGGVINTPVLHLLLRHPLKVAVATSSYMIGITGAAAGLVYFARGVIDVAPTFVVMLGTLTGAATVAHYGQRISSKYLKAAFSLMLVLVSLKMFLNG